MNPTSFIPDTLISGSGIITEDICYALRLSGIKKRKISQAPQGAFSSLMSGLSNAITSATSEAFLLRMTDEKFWLISDKVSSVCFDSDAISKTADVIPGDIKISLFFPSGEIESALFSINQTPLSTAVSGNSLLFLQDFLSLSPNHISDNFCNVVISKNSGSPELYSHYPVSNGLSIVGYNSNGIYFINHSRFIPFSDIIATYHSGGYYELVFRSGSDYMLAEVFTSPTITLPPQSINLIRDIECTELKSLFPIPDTAIVATHFISSFSSNNLKLLSVDNSIYILNNGIPLECGIFRCESDLYVKTSDGNTTVYHGCEEITDTLTLLPSGFSNIFMNLDEPQPALLDGNLHSFEINDEGIKFENQEFLFTKIENCHYSTDDFSCSISFTYNGENHTLHTSNPLGIHICKTQENTFISSATATYTTEQLYESYYQRRTLNHLACTFSEFFKTCKLMNVDGTPSELIAALYSESSPVLRSAFQSIISNFKNVNDLQSSLLQKVTLLELQRKKIQKLFDEWVLYYPHYLASIQVKWLRYAFGSDIDNELTDKEYRKCVNYHKRILSASNNYIKNTLTEIGDCISKMYDALPDEAKRTDIISDLRVNTSYAHNMLKDGSNAVNATAAGLEITNIFLNGISAANPLAISMTATTLVSSYSKDVDLRKNIRTFSLQALEWWEIFSKGIRIQMTELSSSFNTYNKMCIKRDKAIYDALPEDKKESAKARITEGLKEKICESVNDKFTEILPLFHLRISDIIDELKSFDDTFPEIIDEFSNNLYK